MQLRIKVTPNADSDVVVGWEDQPLAGRVLLVRLKAPPVGGKANRALVACLARNLNLPKSAVRLVKGQSSRIKTVQVPDGTPLPEG